MPDTTSSGGPTDTTGLPREGVRGLAQLCGSASGSNADGAAPAAPAPVTADPWFLHVYPGTGIYANNTDCLPDCPRLPDMDLIIAAFLLARGDFGWMGYEYNGCADAMDSPYKNHGGMNYWAPSRWSDLMAEEFDARCCLHPNQAGGLRTVLREQARDAGLQHLEGDIRLARYMPTNERTL